MLIEVSDSTLRFDRHTKVALYARHGIAEVWLVDLVTPALHVFRQPSGSRYSDVARIDAPGSIEVGALPGIAVDLTGLFEF